MGLEIRAKIAKTDLAAYAVVALVGWSDTHDVKDQERSPTT